MSTPRFHWFNPLNYDNRDLNPAPGKERKTTPDYRLDVVRAAERLGYESVLYMVGGYCNDPWLAAAAHISQTSKIKFIVAARPGYTHPAVIAHQVASFQELSNNRLWLNIVTASHEAELRGYGDFLDKDARYRRTDEFLEILTRSWKGKPFDFEGEHYKVEGAGLKKPLEVEPVLFSGGSSPAGQEIGAKWANIHLSYGEPPPLARERVEEVSERADKHGRKVEFGMKIHVIARRTHEEAWKEADRLLDGLDPELIAKQQKTINARASVGQARVQALNPGHKNDPEALKPYPTMWSGIGLTGAGGGSTALVGSYEEVAERIAEYASVGVTHMLFSTHPHLEGAYEVAEGILPYFRKPQETPQNVHELRAGAAI
jgi:alkanesulfonate monooxygenase